MQVSAHGTGASIPPVDEMVVSMKLITPARETLEVSRREDPELFEMARVGLGALGVVSEVTLQLVPAHQLLEHTYIMSSKVRRTCFGTCRNTAVSESCEEKPQSHAAAVANSAAVGAHQHHVLTGAHHWHRSMRG